MAKKKVVIEVSMKNQKSRSIAMKIAVGVYGVESAAIQGDNKDQIEVTGVGIDSVELTRKLRKNFCYANLVSVGDVEKKEDKKEEKEEKKEEKKKEEEVVVWSNGVPVPHCNCSIIRDPYQYYEDPYKCSIM
ncbi:unnamed protein product [Vicia faba]|uniref:Uncharacterized protein n=1 Tax=Vicia faba TaxID=3906 RepID=A0AAV0ZNB2_VICFA|nr:unnamed protein product [Vicia faba]